MHSLIVVSHPDAQSLTHAVATAIGQGITGTNAQHSVEFADLNAEGFDPRFTLADHRHFLKQAPAPMDIAAEQARLDRAQALVLVYPVYWWSLPALLKGWIDRVFAQGWAYSDTPEGKVVKQLQHLTVHLVGVGGADNGTYARHGYASAMNTQIDHGIFDYCGAPVGSSTLLLPSDGGHGHTHLRTAHEIGTCIFASHGAEAM